MAHQDHWASSSPSYCREPFGGAQPGNRASLHHQPADPPWDRQPVLDPSFDREPRRGARATGRRDGAQWIRAPPDCTRLSPARGEPMGERRWPRRSLELTGWRVSRQTIAVPAGAGISYSHSRNRASCVFGISASSAAVVSRAEDPPDNDHDDRGYRACPFRA